MAHVVEIAQCEPVEEAQDDAGSEYDEVPDLKTSFSDDDSGSESEDEVDAVDVQTSKFWTPSDAFLQCHPNGQQTFELYEGSEDEKQEHDLSWSVPAPKPTATCVFDQQKALPQIRSVVPVTNNQSDCKNGHPNNQVVS